MRSEPPEASPPSPAPRGGRLQLRRAPPGRTTKAAEQAFFRALSATANVRLSAAAAGFAHASFHARARKDPAFADRLAACAAAARADLDRAIAAEAAAVAAGLSIPFDPFPDGWPEGLTVAHALRARGIPPMRLPGMGFPKRKPKR